MRVALHELGKIGIIYDIADHELPPNAWSDGNNVVFRDGFASKIGGHSQVLGTVGCRPQWMIDYRDPVADTNHWIYPGFNDSNTGVIYSVTGTTHTDRSQAGNYSWTPTGDTLFSNLPIFTMSVLNGLPIVNCSSDIPQKWDRTAGTLKADFEDLANWPTTWLCKSLRPFKGFLVAMDINVSTNTPTRNPYRVAWSDVIDTQFSEPSTWVAASSNLAGDAFLTDTDGYVVDGVELRGSFIIFKEDSTYIMDYIGGNDVMSFRLLFNKHGLLAPNCFAKVQGERIFFVTNGDIMITDGNTAQSVADAKVREKIFSEINNTFYNLGGAYCVEHYAEEEIWFCYSTSSNSLADKAAIWNYETGAWSFRDLPSAPCVASGFIESAQTLWSDLASSPTEAWNGSAIDGMIWIEGVQQPGSDELLIAERGSTDTTANAQFNRADDTNRFDGSEMVSYLTRTGLDIVGEGIPKEYPPIVKYIRRLWPKIHGGPVDINVGAAFTEDGPYTWYGSQKYDSTSDYKMDLRITGRYFAIDIRSNANVEWELNSLDIEMETAGDGR